MKQITILLAASRLQERDRVASFLAGRKYRVLAAPLDADLAMLVAREPHQIALLLLDGTEASMTEYRAYRESAAPVGVKLVVACSDPTLGAHVKAAADAWKDRSVIGPFEREAIHNAVAAATRHLLTVLVADDEPLIRKMYNAFLTGQGYKVVTAEDGEDALQKVNEILPDLLITDIRMPRRDGYDLCRAVKESRDTQHIPVIIVSALATELDADRGFNSGANEYITKPIDMIDLGHRIHSIFQGIAMRGRERVLVACYSQIERSMVELGLSRQGFEVESCRDADECLEAARKAPPGIIVVDFGIGLASAMVGGGTSTLDIFQLRERLKADRKTKDVPVVVLVERDQKIDKRERLDAVAILRKPYGSERLAAQIERVLGERRLRLEVEQKAMLEAIMMIVTALEARDRYTRGHSENVARYSMMIARHVYESEEERARLQLSARLHDIGKIGVPDAILLKPGKLTDEEMDMMKTHPMKGVEILSAVPSLQDILPGVRWHHERLDGKGYPDKLTAADIPLQARIIAVGDTFDALTSHRPYRKGCPIEKAIGILRSAAGDQLDPKLVEIFIREIDESKLVIPAAEGS